MPLGHGDKDKQLQFFESLVLLASLPGLTGQPSIAGHWLPGRTLKPGDDSMGS
jgi:hypothetical protein